MRWAIALAACLALSGCATYREDLNRGQRYYQESEYERALAVWRMLEPDLDSLEFKDQARYAYLRGMTDFSLGFRADARHWLAIAKAVEQEHAGGLTPAWKQRLETTLAELNEDVYKGGEGFTKKKSTADVNTLAPAPTDTPAGAKPACTTNADCPEGNTCQSSECVPL